jgi:ferritin-like protein
MLGEPRVIEYLNKALRHELAAVNQYWLHYRILDNWGYKEFAKTWRAESIEEMRHGPARRAHPVPGRPAQHAVAGPAQNRQERQGNP